jgi:hypothetical protein
MQTRLGFQQQILEVYSSFMKIPEYGKAPDYDACKKLGAGAQQQLEMYEYQKFVREYVRQASPYRGLLVYHGLGSGKTCSSIGVAESLLNNKKIYVLLPASLQENFKQELRTCGNPIYMNNNFWETRVIHNRADKGPALAMSIPDDFLRKQGRYFVTVPGKESNYNTLPLDVRRGIDAQISALIGQLVKD